MITRNAFSTSCVAQWFSKEALPNRTSVSCWASVGPHLYFIEQDKLIDWKDKGFTLVQTVDTNKRAPNLACACGMQRMLAMPSDDVSCSRIRFPPTAYDLFPVALQVVVTYCLVKFRSF